MAKRFYAKWLLHKCKGKLSAFLFLFFQELYKTEKGQETVDKKSKLSYTDFTIVLHFFRVKYKIQEEIFLKKTVSMIMALVLVCAMAFTLVGCGGESNAPYANVLDSFKGALEGNGKALVSVFPPEYDALMGIMGMSLDDLAKEFEADYADTNVTGVSYKVEKEEALDADTISSMNEERQLYTTMGVEVKDITKGYKVEVTFTGTSEGETSSHPVTMTVIEIDGKWYIDPDTMKM